MNYADFSMGKHKNSHINRSAIIEIHCDSKSPMDYINTIWNVQSFSFLCVKNRHRRRSSPIFVHGHRNGPFLLLKTKTNIQSAPLKTCK